MIRYYQAELPARVKAFTVCKDDCYTIVVNSILSRRQQLREIEHELSHIHLGHLTGSRDAGMTESGREGEDMRETEREAVGEPKEQAEKARISSRND